MSRAGTVSIRNIVIPHSSRIELREGNPKLYNSQAYRRFKLYRHGMTVGDFLRRGGNQRDLRWDTEHGFIKIFAA